MSIKFDEKFAELINHNVPRTFILTPDTDNSDIPIECQTLEIDKLPKPPADGFIATYCQGDTK